MTAFIERNASSRKRLLRLALTGAAMTVVAPAAHAAVYVFSNGNYNPGVTSPNPLGAGDVLQIIAGGNKFFNAVAFTNNGRVDWSDSFYMQSGASITNNGLFNALGDDTIIYNGGATTVFNNTGIFRKNGGLGTTTIGGIAFVNSGTIDAATGTIAFNGNDATFNAGTSFIGAGINAINSNATFNGTFSSSNLHFNAGNFNGNNAVLTGTAFFNGGNFTGSWTIDNGDTLFGIAGANKFLNGGAVTNNGTIDWQTNDALYMQSGAALVNNGLFVANADMALVYNGGADPVFTNAAGGTLKAAGGVTLNVQNHLENSGTLRADGTIRYLASNAAFNNGSIFTGTGVNRVETTATFNGGYTSSNLELAGGSFIGNSAVANGNTSFTGGRFTGSWEIAAGQTITGNTGGSKFMNAGTFTNKGTLDWRTNDALYFESNANLVNQALIDINADTTFAYNGGSQPNLINTASGTIHAAAGKTLNIGTFLTSNGGTFTADGTINYGFGNSVFNAGTLFNGAGSNNVVTNAVFNGAFTSASNLVFASASFIGNNAQVNGTATFTGGRFTGSWEIAAGQTLNGANGGSKFMNAGTFTNNGTFNWNTNDALYFESDANLVNNAQLNINESTTYAYNGGSQPYFRNAASGNIHVASGKTFNVGTYFVSDGGTITSDGTTFLSHGSAVINAGSTFNGAGTTQVTNNTVFNGGFTSSNLVFASNSFIGNGAVIGGSADFSGGRFTGTWTIGSGQTLNAVTGGTKYMNAGTFTNAGTLNWSTNDTLYFESDANLVNNGMIDFKTDAAFIYNGGSQPHVTNNGTIIKTGGGGTTTIGNTLDFQNNGTIDVRTGTIRLPDNFSNAGTLTGSGAFALNGTLTNAGTIAPGVGAGTLTLNGNYVQTNSGIFAAQLQSSSLADLFVVNGTAALAGNLNISCIGGCNIATGDVFTIFDATGPLSGTFANVTTSGFLQGFQYDVIYDYAQNWVQLKVLDKGMVTPPVGVPEPATWAMMIAGFAMAGAGVRRRRATLPRVAA
ncbi:MAG: PEP-CTERM sorting domain-containing protein [Proteobacteria bacterium]|nr:PEP-CTERM sorting domain-containing protein [Pseudomonadota bacterium]